MFDKRGRSLAIGTLTTVRIVNLIVRMYQIAGSKSNLSDLFSSIEMFRRTTSLCTIMSEILYPSLSTVGQL
jgi:hypothetical protein